MTADDDVYREALSRYDRDEFAAAAEALERVLAARPGHVEARYKLANARRELGDWAAAAAHYEHVLTLDPSHAEALNNLGAAYQSLGRAHDAESCYRRSLGLRPGLAQPYMNLGRLLQGEGRTAEAAVLYRAALAHGLDPGLFGHLLQAAGGGNAGANAGGSESKAPEGYVRETFDAFAAQFDSYLTGALDYRVPSRLAALVPATGEVLDLGCGTGLMGEALAGPARLVGVDLSPKMLEAARRRGRYGELHEAEVEQWLKGAAAATFDAVFAADVFIYIGRLEGVFPEVKRVLRPAGRFAFSVESCEGDGWRLLETGRYAQSRRYIERLAADAGFRIELGEPATIRKGIEGEIYVLA